MAEMVAAELRRQIYTGELAAGDRLCSEEVLRTRFDISRPTLREALRLLEAEALISVSRGSQGGARVKQFDMDVAARQVSVHLRVAGATLEDVWLARTVIEPAAAGLLAASPAESAFAELEANIAASREASEHDPLRYADLSAEFSMIVTRRCGNRTLHMFASLMHQLVRRQHEHVIALTLRRPGVDELRQESIRSRETLLALMRTGQSAAAEAFWCAQVQRMRDLALAAYEGPTTLDVLDGQVSGLAPVPDVKRSPRPFETSRLRGRGS